eukprot:745622-Hanusia_phi.AAC.3
MDKRQVKRGENPNREQEKFTRCGPGCTSYSVLANALVDLVGDPRLPDRQWKTEDADLHLQGCWPGRGKCRTRAMVLKFAACSRLSLIAQLIHRELCGECAD